MTCGSLKRVILFLILSITLVYCYNDDNDYGHYYYGEAPSPPRELRVCPGDRSLTLFFQLPSYYEYGYEYYYDYEYIHAYYDIEKLTAFMARGDYTVGKAPGDPFNDPDISMFDQYGDGIVLKRISGIAPVAMVDPNNDRELATLGVTNTTEIFWTIRNADEIPAQGQIGLEDSSDEQQEEPANIGDDCTWGEGDRLCLVNGVRYTTFLVNLGRGNIMSNTSNYISFVPRPEREELIMTGNGRIDCEGSDSNAIDLGGADEARFDLITFTNCVENYQGQDSMAAADLVLTSMPNHDSEIAYELRPALVAANGAVIQDLGYFEDWCDMTDLPTNETVYSPAGDALAVVDGHLYAIRTGDNHYAKIWITAVDYATSLVTFKAAYQVAEWVSQL
jgi:hypothetical protein